jgi:hypothetical protein
VSELKRLNLMLPPEIYDAVGRLATADDRSMNNWIIHMVSQHLKALEASNGDESR